MAKMEVPHTDTRSIAMAETNFSNAFDRAQKRLFNSSVAFVEVKNPLELYVFEVYAAMTLGTSKWNSFRTH